MITLREKTPLGKEYLQYSVLENLLPATDRSVLVKEFNEGVKFTQEGATQKYPERHLATLFAAKIIRTKEFSNAVIEDFQEELQRPVLKKAEQKELEKMVREIVVKVQNEMFANVLLEGHSVDMLLMEEGEGGAWTLLNCGEEDV